MAVEDYIPDSEIDPITGKLRQVQLQAGSIVQTGINRELLYTKAEVDARINSALAGGDAPIGPAGGDLTGTYPNPTLSNTSNVQSIVQTDSIPFIIALG